jgi:hypothetical protein
MIFKTGLSVELSATKDWIRETETMQGFSANRIRSRLGDQEARLVMIDDQGERGEESRVS